MSIEGDLLDELREQTKWLRLLGFQALRPLLQTSLRDDRQKSVYEYSDGKRSSREVAALAGVSPALVGKLWPEWIASGLCTESPARPGRAQHLAPLWRLGIEVPAPTVRTTGASGKLASALLADDGENGGSGTDE